MILHPPSQWPAATRRLLAFCGCMVALLLAGHFLFLAPMRQNYSSLRMRVEEKAKRLDKAGWPKREEALRRQLENAAALLNGDNSQGLPGLEQITEDTLELCTYTFRKRISAHFPGGIAAFMNGVSRIDYKLVYDHFASRLSAEGVELSANAFGLNDELNEPLWRMIFKLWTADELVRLALASHLRIAGDENGFARIHALEPLSYTLSSTPSAQPYLLEFPVQMTLQGTSANFLLFLDSLQSGTRFLSAKELSIHTSPPAVPETGGDVTLDHLDFTIVCSSFFRLPAPDSSGGISGKGAVP